MNIKKILSVMALSLLVCFNLAACGAGSGGAKVLLCYAGDSRDEFGGSVYASAVTGSGCKFDVLELGSDEGVYADDVAAAISEKDYKTVVIAGREAYDGLESYVKSFKGMKFIALDCHLTEIRSNVAALEFQPEELGYLGGRLASEGSKGGSVGYLSAGSDSFDSRVLFGFLQGVGDGVSVYTNYIEEKSNVVKAKDYVSAMFGAGAARVFDASGRSSLGSLDGAKECGGEIIYGGINLAVAAAESRGEETLSAIGGGVEKNYATAMKHIKEMAKNGFETGNAQYLTAEDGAFIAEGATAAGVRRLADDRSGYERLCGEKIVSDDTAYTPKYSVEAPYHEAVPSCADTNDWKYAPRAGSGNGTKPSGWKGVGVWSTIYLQDGKNPVSNTGIEFQNMKIWAYTESVGWKLLEHANPKGSFYDENFSNDAHTSFISNYINYGEEKRTRIKLDYSTKGYNYHPFGSQIDLVAAGFLNADGTVKNGETLYILSEMDIRLCVWDSALPSDMDDAKYVANIGADWWREIGLGWTPDWNSNKDVCVGQFRTITKDWKRLYMTNVPSGLYGEIFKNFPFEQ